MGTGPVSRKSFEDAGSRPKLVHCDRGGVVDRTLAPMRIGSERALWLVSSVVREG